MEFLLLLWDELDDWAAACRHVTSNAASEFASLTAPVAAASSALTVWLLLPHFRFAAVILGSTATFWGAYRHFARLAG